MTIAFEGRRRKDVLLRKESFGGVCYVHSRNDFFMVSERAFRVAMSLAKWRPIEATDRSLVEQMASFGIIETRDPVISETAYSGPSLLDLPEIPVVADPLVVNCFCTAHCPLRCVYCYADDLMYQYRASESDQDLERVIETARGVPALVAVITGGDPLTRPERAIRLIEALSSNKALVLDTSGAGNIAQLISALKRYNVHIRVSLDGISLIHDKARPLNPQYVSRAYTSREYAISAIKSCVASGLSVTVQTVISSRNDNESELRELRDYLVSAGVRHWVLHFTVNAGSAWRLQRSADGKARGGILPGSRAKVAVRRLVRETIAGRYPIDIRCTETDERRNSVLLISSTGDLYTEGMANPGKRLMLKAGTPPPKDFDWTYLDRLGHVIRYVNWLEWLHGRTVGTGIVGP